MAKGTVELISMAEYARRRGVTEGAVRKAVKDERISMIGGKIDPVVADTQWVRNTRVRAASGQETLPLGADGAPAAPETPAEPPEVRRDAEYLQSRGRREKAEAEMAELKLAAQRGEYVRADAIKASLAREFASVREGLLQMPARIVPALCAEPEPGRMTQILLTEIRAVLEQLTMAH